jgi:hypothetical protein
MYHGFQNKFESFIKELRNNITKNVCETILNDNNLTFNVLFRKFKIFSLKNLLNKQLALTASKLSFIFLFYLNKKDIKYFNKFYLSTLSIVNRMLSIAHRTLSVNEQGKITLL